MTSKVDMSDMNQMCECIVYYYDLTTADHEVILKEPRAQESKTAYSCVWVDRV